uniref:Pentatricopeptide repeat-containing protein n=1 Tax=Aegilops tauschii subsp. strangulata TaxID=200361 RepID=A0A452Y1X0_AEGTS
HAVLLKLGLSASAILATSLAHLALRCGLPGYARALFDEMPRRDVVSWTSLITGHAHQGLHGDSLALLRRMVESGVAPNGYTLSGGLLACAGVGQGALAAGKEIHARVVKMSMYGPVDSVVENGVLDMSGQAEETLGLFASMVSCEVVADGFSYAIIVDACGELALLKQGMQVHARVLGAGFDSDVVVRNSLLDMYAKCGRGHLEDALEFIESMPFESSIAAWSALLNSCRIYGDAKLGQLAASRLLELDPENHSNWVALSSKHASEGDWHETWM